MYSALTSFIISLLLIIVPNILNQSRKLNGKNKEEIMRDSNYYVLYYILSFLIICPWIMQHFPESYSTTAQICIGLLVLILDWPSLYQDKTRFSEKAYCLFGNCRLNSLYTGILAHLGDTLGVAMSILAAINMSTDVNIQTNGKLFLGIGTIMWALLGCYFVYELTKKGSESDLRNLKEEEKCKRNKIMKDEYRGILNLVITFFGVFMGWQSIMEIGNGTKKISKNNILISWITEIYKFLFNSKNVSTQFIIHILKSIFVIVLAIVPTYTNHINTSFQYSAPASDLGLPSCFD